MLTSTCAGGLSRARLGRLHDVMAGHVAGGDMPGLVTLMSRGGEVHVDVIGNMAIGGAPMQRDTIFRISSMTKPVTAAAAMMLVEECKLRLDDPVDPWLPELADRKVLCAIDGPLDDTVPARRAITLRDLLTFRLGLGMLAVFPDRYPIQKAVAEAGFAPGPVFPSFAPDELMRRYGSLPLLYQPGERWLYNSGTEILGVLIARVAGMSFADIGKLRLAWAFAFPDSAGSRSQPAVADGAAFVGSQSGAVYALDARTGCLYWKFDAAGEIRGAIIYRAATRSSQQPVVYFGDVFANVYAVDARTGSQLWHVRVDTHPAARIAGSPTVFGDRIYVPLGSWGEELAAASPDYICCTFRGSLTAIRRDSGQRDQHWNDPDARSDSVAGGRLGEPHGVAIASRRIALRFGFDVGHGELSVRRGGP